MKNTTRKYKFNVPKIVGVEDMANQILRKKIFKNTFFLIWLWPNLGYQIQPYTAWNNILKIIGKSISDKMRGHLLKLLPGILQENFKQVFSVIFRKISSNGPMYLEINQKSLECHTIP